MGQKPRLPRRGGELPFRCAQHKDVVGAVQPHLAGRRQHDGVQRLGDVPQVRAAQQQREQFGVLVGGDGLLPQQAGHLVQQPHHHVPLPGGLLGGGDALRRPQLVHLPLLGLLGPEGFEAEPQRPADLARRGLPAAGPQRLDGPHQAGAAPVDRLEGCLVLRLPLLAFTPAAEAPGALGKVGPPLGGPRGPGVGVVFQRAGRLFVQAGQPGLDQGGQLLGVVAPAHQLQQGGEGRRRRAESRGGGLVAPQGDVRHTELIADGGAVVVHLPADHRDLPAAHPLAHQPADGPGGGPGLLLPAGGGVEAYLPRRAGVAAGLPRLQQPRQGSKAGGLLVPQVLLQQHRGGHLGPAAAGQRL